MRHLGSCSKANCFSKRLRCRYKVTWTRRDPSQEPLNKMQWSTGVTWVSPYRCDRDCLDGSERWSFLVQTHEGDPWVLPEPATELTKILKEFYYILIVLIISVHTTCEVVGRAMFVLDQVIELGRWHEFWGTPKEELECLETCGVFSECYFV